MPDTFIAPEVRSQANVQAVRHVPVVDKDRRASGVRIVPLIITLATVVLAGLLGWAMWNEYMGTPWTRDGTVRTYIVTLAPEVDGRIVGLQVHDNQFVHKGDLLMVIDPTNYRIAVDLAEAKLKKAQVTAQNARIEAERRAKLTTLAVSVEEQQKFLPEGFAPRPVATPDLTGPNDERILPAAG